MSFAEQLAADMAAFINLDEFAETIEYTAYGEDPVTISAVVMREPYIKQQIGTDTYLVKAASLLIQASDLPAEPNPDGDFATFDDDANDEPLKWETDQFKPVGASIAYKIHVTRKELISSGM